MGPVAKRFISGMFAAAPGYFFFFGYFHSNWRKFTPLVRSVAKRLILGFTAGAPEIFARLYI
jgi:hypothetical protein